MPTQKHDVLIIGAGVIGVCLAHYLLQEGREVTIVDKGGVGGGASHGNAGLIVPSHATPLASPAALREGLRGLLDPDSSFHIKLRPDRALLPWLLRFALASRGTVTARNGPLLLALGSLSAALYGDLIPLGELDCDYEQAGLLEAYNDPQRFAHARAEAAALQALGRPITVRNQEETLDFEPSLSEKVVGSVAMGADAHLHPGRFMAEMGQWLTQRGATILTDTAVTGAAATGRSVTTIYTDKGALTAAEYVLAAGAWSPQIGRQLGLRIPIQAAKGYSVTLQRPPQGPSRPVMLMESRVAATPMGDLLRLAGTLELAGIDLRPNPRRMAAIMGAVPRYFRQWPETPVVETWAGLRPVTPDGLPIIGRPPQYNNLLLATGHAMLGMSLGPATGLLGAQLLLGRTPDLDLAPYRYERF